MTGVVRDSTLLVLLVVVWPVALTMPVRKLRRSAMCHGLPDLHHEHDRSKTSSEVADARGQKLCPP